MPDKALPPPRSGCPIGIALDIIGDRWSLLIIRDLMVRGYRSFKEFQQSGEGIATNILSDRLRRLAEAGILVAEPAESDGRRVYYRLTAKGIDLAPVLLDLLLWSARHENTAAPRKLLQQLAQDREAILAEVQRRWRTRDTTPLIPKFTGGQ